MTPARGEPPVDAQRLRILVVDDSDANRLALEAMLTDLDVSVATARSGADALRALLRDDYALILLDIRMPGLDGFETARLIRARDRSRVTPIMFLSAVDRSREEELRGYALGAVDFLSKPVVPEVLRGKVAVLIELQRKAQEIRRQAALLEETQRSAHAQALEVERRRWAQEALEAQMRRERQHAELLQRANARLRLHLEVANDLLLAAEPETPARILPRLFERVTTHVPVEIATWHELTRDGLLVLAAQVGLSSDEIEGMRSVEAGMRAIGEAAERGTVRAFAPGDVLARPPAMSAGAAFPVLTGSGVAGVLTFGTRSGRGLEPDELSTLELVSRAVSAALERWRLLSELRAGAAELRDADARKDQFLAMLGHELRNPLAPVLNAVKLMQGREQDPKVRRVVAAASRQIKHITRLLDDLLDVSRIRNGKIELKRIPVDVRDVIHDAVHATEPAFVERGHELIVELPDEPLVVDGDPVRLAQVFGNLLHNAAKYTDDGGHVRIALRREGPDVVIGVRDDGIGMPVAMLPRVFELFVQIDQGADRAKGGLGLGLTLVRSLIRMHGGEVTARSDGPGRGSEFEVRLPELAGAEAPPRPVSPPLDTAAANGAGGARNGATNGTQNGATNGTQNGATNGTQNGATNGTQNGAPSGSPRPAAGHPLRIVLVEDNPDIRDSLKALLELRGHDVLEAEDGPRGVEIIRTRSPNVALVDIGLPGIDGYQVARELSATEGTTRLIAMTGYGRPDDRRLAFEAGFHAHLVKPVDFDELTRLIEQLT